MLFRGYGGGGFVMLLEELRIVTGVVNVNFGVFWNR